MWLVWLTYYWWRKFWNFLHSSVVSCGETKIVQQMKNYGKWLWNDEMTASPNLVNNTYEILLTGVCAFWFWFIISVLLCANKRVVLLDDSLEARWFMHARIHSCIFVLLLTCHYYWLSPVVLPPNDSYWVQQILQRDDYDMWFRHVMSCMCICCSHQCNFSTILFNR